MKALFLTVIIILAVAGVGSIWVWQKGEDTTPLPMVDNEPQNGTPETHTDVEVIQPRINPETGWKIFEDKDGVITFEYPTNFSLVSKLMDQRQYFSVSLKNENYYFRIRIPPPERGFEGAEKFISIPVILGASQFSIDLLDFSFTPEEPHIIAFLPYDQWNPFLELLGYPTPNVGGFYADIQCNKEQCSQEEAKSIMEQIISSIRLASDPR